MAVERTSMVSVNIKIQEKKDFHGKMTNAKILP